MIEQSISGDIQARSLLWRKLLRLGQRKRSMVEPAEDIELLELLFVELDPLQEGFAGVLIEVSTAAESGTSC
jgi:hypothetical protein